MNNNQVQTILVVDDTPENIDVLRGVLQDDYKIKVALNGTKALEIVVTSPPDLILLDIMMPGMDGYEVCRRLKESAYSRKIPVIFVTAKGEIEDETQVQVLRHREGGARGFHLRQVREGDRLRQETP